MNLTDEERIRKYIAEERLFEILKAKDTAIVKVATDRNSVGEFLFIYAKVKSGSEFYAYCSGCRRCHVGPYQGIAFCGMGFDEKAGRFIETSWRFYGAMSFSVDTGILVPPAEVIAAIEKRRPI